MTDIIKRLEAATGPNRELDAEIACLSGDYKRDRGRDGMLIEIETGYAVAGGPKYTASIDAAMALVPDGFATEKMSQWPLFAYAQVWGMHECQGELMRQHEDGKWEAEAKTLPLAICIASLRSRGIEG